MTCPLLTSAPGPPLPSALPPDSAPAQRSAAQRSARASCRSSVRPRPCPPRGLHTAVPPAWNAFPYISTRSPPRFAQVSALAPPPPPPDLVFITLPHPGIRSRVNELVWAGCPASLADRCVWEDGFALTVSCGPGSVLARSRCTTPASRTNEIVERVAAECFTVCTSSVSICVQGGRAGPCRHVGAVS